MFACGFEKIAVSHSFFKERMFSFVDKATSKKMNPKQAKKLDVVIDKYTPRISKSIDAAGAAITRKDIFKERRKAISDTRKMMSFLDSKKKKISPAPKSKIPWKGIGIGGGLLLGGAGAAYAYRTLMKKDDVQPEVQLENNYETSPELHKDPAFALLQPA